MKKKVVKFEGYMSGDYECFCLSRVPFEKWVEKQRELEKIEREDEAAFEKWHKELEALTLYPSNFFPSECKRGKWRFTITVEANKR